MTKEEIIRKAALYDEKYGTAPIEKIDQGRIRISLLILLPFLLLLGNTKQHIDQPPSLEKKQIPTEIGIAPNHI